MDVAEKRGEIIKHLEAALALTDEIALRGIGSNAYFALQ